MSVISLIEGCMSRCRLDSCIWEVLWEEMRHICIRGHTIVDVTWFRVSEAADFTNRFVCHWVSLIAIIFTLFKLFSKWSIPRLLMVMMHLNAIFSSRDIIQSGVWNFDYSELFLALKSPGDASSVRSTHSITLDFLDVIKLLVVHMWCFDRSAKGWLQREPIIQVTLNLIEWWACKWLGSLLLVDVVILCLGVNLTEAFDIDTAALPPALKYPHRRWIL